MTWHGQIRNGSIILDQPPSLPDGTEVEIEVRAVEPQKSRREQIEKLSEDIQYDFNAIDRQREASKL